jgi:hypothetical protein
MNRKLKIAWKNMKQRCLNPNDPRYKYYGARGIKICDKWLYFDGFLEDMESGAKPGLTLDRIDNNGNYCKKNCRWVTMKEQNCHKRWNRKITLNGITKNLHQWSDSLGIKRSTITQRIDYYGWSIDRALRGAN